MGKKITLYEQAIIEQKRRNMQKNKTAFSPRKEYAAQMAVLLPQIEWKEKQRKFINARQFITWYLGGYKSGKTFTGIAEMIWLAYINRPYSGIVVHPTFDGIQLTILPLIEEICRANSIEYELKKLSTKYKVIFKFGLSEAEWGYVWLVSGDVPKSLKGPKLAFGMIDEPLIMKEEITEIIMSRIAESKGVLPKLIFTGTPEPEHMQWGFDIVDEKEQDTPERFITTISTREVKEYLRPGYIEDFERNNSPAKVRTFIDGEYQNLSQGKVYETFDIKKNLYDKLTQTPARNIEDNAERELVIGYDFNVNQMSAVLIELAGCYKTQLEEFRIRSTSDTAELTVMIINRLKTLGYIGDDGLTRYRRSLLVTGDASGKAHSTKSKKSDYEIIRDEFENAGIEISIYVPEVNPSVRDRINYINRQFQNETFLISSDCKFTRRDRELASWKLGADGFHIDKSKSELTHLSDAGDYAVWNTRMITESGGETTISLRERSRR